MRRTAFERPNSMVTMVKSLRSESKGFTLVELMIVVAIIGILAAIAIPSYMKNQTKARQAEAQTSLKSIYTAEISYLAEFNTYQSVFSDLGWEAETTRRYTYNLGNGVTGKLPAVTCASVIAAVSSTPMSFTAQACGQVDTDTIVDDWYINTGGNIMNQLNDANL